MIRIEDEQDHRALRVALLFLEQIAKRSKDSDSRVLAATAAAELRARADAAIFDQTLPAGEPPKLPLR